MSKNRKVLITCAVTGAIHTPSMSALSSVTPEEIIDAAVGAAEAGAALVHVHARDPVTGKPDQSPEAFAKFLPIIKQRTNAVINITTGGAPTMLVEERLKPCAVFKPEVGLAEYGFDEFRPLPDAGPVQGFPARLGVAVSRRVEGPDFQEHLPGHRKHLTTCAENGTRFEIECYDIGHLYTPLPISWIVASSNRPSSSNRCLAFSAVSGRIRKMWRNMKRTAGRLFGNDYQWSVLGAGRNQLAIAAMAVSMGGNLRVALKIRSGSVRASLPNRMRNRCVPLARSSRDSGSRSRRRMKRATFFSSRARTRSRSEALRPDSPSPGAFFSNSLL